MEAGTRIPVVVQVGIRIPVVAVEAGTHIPVVAVGMHHSAPLLEGVVVGNRTLPEAAGGKRKAQSSIRLPSAPDKQSRARRPWRAFSRRWVH